MLLQGIAEAVRCVLCLRTGAWPARLHDVEETETMMLQKRQDMERAAGGTEAPSDTRGDREMVDRQESGRGEAK